MQRHARLTTLFELISDRESVTVEELVAELGVSAATIRRDLDQLAQQQLITRTHGGATTAPTSSDIPLRYKSSARHAKEKRKIARTAAALALPGEVIGLNGGTTTTELARELALREDLQTEDANAQIVIMTNAVNIANELAVRPQMKVVLTGGVVRPMSFELSGPMAMKTLDDVAIDTLFLGVNGIDLKGAYADHDGEAAVNTAFVQQAQRTIVVADHTKVGAQAFARICPLGQIDVLVTDSGANPELLQQLREQGVEVILT